MRKNFLSCMAGVALMLPSLVCAQAVSAWESAPGAEASAEASPAPAPVASTVPVSSAPAAPSLSSDQALFQTMYESGKSTQNIGRMMSWGGLALSALGSSLGNTTLYSVGNLSLMVGIPLNGYGSSKMVKGANGLNSRAQLEHRGWIPYGIGCGLVGFGMYNIASGLSEYNNNYDPDDEVNEPAMEKIGKGVLVLMVGEVCWFVAWYKFSDSADDANNIAKSVRVSAAPLLVPERDGEGFANGLQLSAAF